MVWSSKRSVSLSLILTVITGILLIAFSVAAPWVIRWYYGESPKGLEVQRVVLIAYYCCLLPAISMIYLLYRLLLNIKKEAVFTSLNIFALRRLSWDCFVICAITLITGFFYAPLLFVSVAALFIGLIIRVVKNVFVAAEELKQENDLTI